MYILPIVLLISLKFTMSRLIVKNLPKNVTSEKVKEKFSEKGRVTDIQLKYTADGKFRNFCFVGYDKPEEAQAAIDYFNNSFFNTSRIKVEFCAELGVYIESYWYLHTGFGGWPPSSVTDWTRIAVREVPHQSLKMESTLQNLSNTSSMQKMMETGDKNKPKAWSKYAPDSSAYERLHKKENEEINKVSKKDKKKKKNKKKINPDLLEQFRKRKNDPNFISFLEAHGMSHEEIDVYNKALNDESNEEKGVVPKTEEENTTEDKSFAHAPISDSDYLKLITNSGDDTLAKDEELKNIIEKSKESVPKENKEYKMKFFHVKLKNLPYSTKKKDIKMLFKPLVPASIRIPKVKGIAYAGFKTEKEMKKALIKNKSFCNGKQIAISEYKDKVNNADSQERWKEQNNSLSKEETIAESGRIFLRNLAYTVTEEELQEMFQKFGPVTEVIVPIDRLTRQVKGFGVVTYMMPEHAVAAYMALDGTVLHGRMLHLLPGKPKHDDADEDADESFKAKKAKKLKATAQSSHTWNTLFLGQDAVAEVIADKYNATKQEVLTGKDAAVRLALGETQIVAETRQFLEENGVKLDAFNQESKKRSKTIILIKNLPAMTKASEIRDIFAKFGELGRVVLPPYGVTGIVEFLEASEARAAFTRLAYSKFKHTPLYLEWAPENALVEKTSHQETVKLEDKENQDKGTVFNRESEEEDEVDLEPEQDTTLFVKNLNFNTDEEALKKHFSSFGKIANVTVAKKKDPANPGKLLSMGYGFLQFYLKSSLNEALKRLQGSELEGHCIELKRSNRTLQTGVVGTRKLTNVQLQTGTKILVRNIPFQATEREVCELFKPFGELKSVRMPKKMVGTGPHRGFGFIDFVTKHDAKRAMKALCQSTHFFGRRLVLEWADNDEDVEQLRKRTAKQFNPDSVKKSKKATAELDVDEHEVLEDEVEEEF